MNPSRILVTGGAGFIGSHLCDHLLALGHKVVAVDNLVNGKTENLAEAKQSPDFQFVEGDILDRQLMDTLTDGVDYVYHLACLGVRHSLHSPIENHRANAEGTLTVLDACRNKQVKHFYYISSSEVYGKVKEFPIRETSLPEPLTVYGASKLVGEHYTHAYNECFGLKTTVLRIFNNYGPRAHYEGDAGEVIPRSIVKLLYDEQPVIFGDGSITRDFFYVKDTARALSGLMDMDNLQGQTLNIGTGKEWTIRFLIESIMELMGKNHIGIKYEGDRPADVPRLWVDASKFYSMTGFKGYPFEDGLRDTIAYYENLTKEKHLLGGIQEKNWVK